MESKKSIDGLRDEIVRLCAPRQILLFSQKQKPCGEICAVKLCVIIAEGISGEVEHRLYIEVESDLPFDVLVYSQDEWEKLIEDEMSFAAHILKTGRVLYAAD